MTALTGEELLAWNDRTFVKWMELVQREPAVLEVACDVRETKDLRELLHHIVMVELRYAQRLCGEAETAYEDVPQTPEALVATHAAAKERMERLLADADFDWEMMIDFVTRSMGTGRASRRVVLVHTLMHGIRHYAQAAMLARKAGYPLGWPMDYLFMGIEGLSR